MLIIGIARKGLKTVFVVDPAQGVSPGYRYRLRSLIPTGAIRRIRRAEQNKTPVRLPHILPIPRQISELPKMVPDDGLAEGFTALTQ